MSIARHDGVSHATLAITICPVANMEDNVAIPSTRYFGPISSAAAIIPNNYE